MKLFMGVLFATLALNGVLSLPARTEDAEVIGGPRHSLTRSGGDADDIDDDDDFTNFKGVIDTGSGYPFLQPNPSVIRVGFFDSFDDLFRRFSARLFPTGWFGRAGIDSDEDDSGELGITSIDPKKANSTSTVKVVDGHKVEVNETVYGDEHSIFKVRVVNIRPLDEGEMVEESDNKNIKPVTQGPNDQTSQPESNESDEKREPLEKKPLENEIQGNIDDPEHSIAKKENIVENTKAIATIETEMLPTTEDINAAFVTDNGLEQQEYSAAVMAEEELNGANGNGNNKFETNMSEENNNNNNDNVNVNINESNDNIDNVENLKVEHTIENNENTEEEVNDNLNESSSSSNADASDKEQEYNDNNNDDDKEADIEIINLKKKNSNYSAATHNKEREGESSSDDEDANATATEMHPTFNDEWGSLNEPTKEQNDFSNDIDVYDVVPIDLSNDIAVNYAANLPLNPDAEFIDGYGPQQSSHSIPKFEKLSLDYTPPSEEDWINSPSK